MEDQLVTLDTVKIANEKGFDIRKYIKIDNSNPLNLKSNYCPREYQPWFLAISQSLLQKWLREKHNIDLWVEKYPNDLRYIFQCPILNRKDIKQYFNTYEDALEIGLKEALKLI